MSKVMDKRVDLTPVDAYFKRKGFVRLTKSRSNVVSTEYRTYDHPEYHIKAQLSSFPHTKKPFICVYFNGNSVKKIREAQYTADQLNSLFTRTDRVVRTAKRYKENLDKQQTVVAMQNKKVASAVRKHGFVVSHDDELVSAPWSGIDVEYRGFQFFVTEKLEAEFKLGRTRYSVTLQEAKQIVDWLYGKDMVPEGLPLWRND